MIAGLLSSLIIDIGSAVVVCSGGWPVQEPPWTIGFRSKGRRMGGEGEGDFDGHGKAYLAEGTSHQQL